MTWDGVSVSSVAGSLALQVYLQDGGGVAQTGVAATDVRMVVLGPDADQATPVLLSGSSWVEVGTGWYQGTIAAGVMSTEGQWLVHVRVASGSSATFRSVVYAIWVGALGHPTRQEGWIPFPVRTAAGLLSTGVVPGDVSTGSWEPPDQAGSALTSVDVRFPTDGGTSLGVGQAWVDAPNRLNPGSARLRIAWTTTDRPVDEMTRLVDVATVRVYMEMLDGSVPVPSVTTVWTELDTGQVAAITLTDAQGRAYVDVAPGDYKTTHQSAGAIFDENNQWVRVVSTTYDPETDMPAEIRSGVGPYALTDGDTLEVRVNGGRVQTAEFRILYVPVPFSLSSAPAVWVAERIQAQVRGVECRGVGEGRQRVSIRTEQAGSEATVEIVGGSAASVLNFPVGVVSGRTKKRAVRYHRVSGSRTTLSLPIDSELVRVHWRALDTSGRPLAGQRVVVVQRTSKALSTGEWVVAGSTRTWLTSANGVLYDEKGGVPTLIRGSIVDILLAPFHSSRYGITVPPTDFQLSSVLEGTPDVYSTVYPVQAFAPRNS